MQPLYEVLKLGAKKNSFSDKFIVEKSTALLNAESKKILSVSVGVFTGDSKLNGDKISYSGKAVFYLCYLDEDGVIKKLETPSEFSGEYKVNNPDDICGYTVSVNAEKTDYFLEGDTITLKAYMLADGEIDLCQTVSAFSGGENIIADRKEISYEKGFGKKSSVYPLEEEFDLNFQVKDVVCQNVDAVITSVQCGIGSIIVDGEAYLRVLLLQNQEKSDIIKEERTIPFRVEIECDEAMPQMTATASVLVRGLKTDISVDENTGKSSVSSSIVLSFIGEAFIEDKTEILFDAFSTAEEIEIEKTNGILYSPEKQVVCDATVSGRAITGELSVGSRVVATCDEKFEKVSLERKDSITIISGVLSMKVYLKDADGVVVCKTLETPISFTCDEPMTGACEIEHIILAKNSYARLISLSEIEIGASLKILQKCKTHTEFSFICKALSLGEKTPCTFPISVYIARRGEDLWTLSKRLGVCPDSLIETNKDLNFPLTGDERIVVYRQK